MTKNATISRHQISSLFLFSAFLVGKKNELWNLGTGGVKWWNSTPTGQPFQGVKSAMIDEYHQGLAKPSDPIMSRVKTPEIKKLSESSEMGTSMHLLWGTLLKFQDWNILGVISWESKGPTPPPPIATLFGGNRRPGGWDRGPNFHGPMGLAPGGIVWGETPKGLVVWKKVSPGWFLLEALEKKTYRYI